MFFLAIIVLVLIYFLFFAIIIFSFQSKISKEYMDTHKTERFYSDKVGADRAAIFDTAEYAVYVRINIVQNAKETLEVSYYSMEKGKSTAFFFALLLEAANRGVKVRIILDAIANGVKGKQNDIMYALKNHPNVDFKLYEPVNIFFPWTINNRLHDKYIIADKKVAILGGRNIGDRFWSPEGYDGELTYDRDILVYNTSNKNDESVIQSMVDYFEEIFNSKYAKDPVKSLSNKKIEIAKEKSEELIEIVEAVRQKYPKYFVKDIDWNKITLKTNKITLIHNPITRFSKDPWILYEIVNLMSKAKKEIFIQSPYIISPKKVTDKSIHKYIKKEVNVQLLTNSEGTTPNFPAFSSYLRHRADMLKSGYKIYEYNGINSIHSKSYMFDNELVMVGSFNMDPRSIHLSTETMLVVHSDEVVDEFNRIRKGYLERSFLVGPDGNYVKKEGNLTPREVDKNKDKLLKFVGFFTRFIEFLL